MLCLRASVILIVVFAISWHDQIRADDPAFVSGFDRFARHGDTESELAGRLLITELSCTACHISNDPQLAAKRGPVLNAAGSRMQRDWIRKYLLAPSDVKHGTTMPDMLASLTATERNAAADALAAFLVSLKEPFAEIKATGVNPVPMEFWNKGNADHGKQLFHQIGCVACHEPDPSYEVATIKPSPLDVLLEQLEPDELKELGLSSAARRVSSVALPKLAEKYTHQSLTFFLLNPEHVRPSGRMPNFNLLAVDAADVATWLMNRDSAAGFSQQSPTTDALPFDESQVKRGRQLFTDLRCASCHDVKGIQSTPAELPAVARKQSGTVKPWASIKLDSTSSCVETNSKTPSQRLTGQPQFWLDHQQAAALTAATGENALSGDRRTIRDHDATLRLLQLNCYACHEREALGGVGRFRKPYFETVGNVDIGDEGRLPPALTGVGKRLTTAWINSVLNGKGSVRPHMTIRMPVFPASATKSLPGLLAKADGAADRPASPEVVFAKADQKTLVEAGRQLMDTGCVQCHSFKGEALPGTVGVDLDGVTKRLHPDWLHDFLKDPGSLKQRTRMPTFFPNGKSQNVDVLNGDVELQIAAMYAYLNDLPNQPLPAKIEEARAQNYELNPADRPIVLRTFMPVAGTHAIAVGFPQRVHFAFDAEHIALAQAWRGRFLDAEGTWFVRFAPPANPLGDHPINLPAGIAVAELKNNMTPWPETAEAANAIFRGYRLDTNGVPTFLYRVGSCDVSDRMEPDERGRLLRSITVEAGSDADATVWLRVLTGTQLQLVPETSGVYANEQGLMVVVSGDRPVQLRTLKDTTEQLIHLPLEADTQTTVNLVYSW